MKEMVGISSSAFVSVPMVNYRILASVRNIVARAEGKVIIFFLLCVIPLVLTKY